MTPQHIALRDECARQEENCLYTSTSLFIWLRILRAAKIAFIALPLVFGSLASFQLLVAGNYKTAVAVRAFLGGLIPTIYEALKLETHINATRDAATDFKNLQDLFRKAKLVSVHKPFEEFELEVNQLLARLHEARKSCITPPEIIFRLAQRKVKSGDYDFDADAASHSTK